MLDVSLLGGLRLRFNGNDVRFAARPKVAPLFAYLLLNGDRPAARDSVAFALWPDDSEASARTNLRRHLQYLRDALPKTGVPWLLSDAKTVCWNWAAPTRVDAVEFERCAGDPKGLREAVDRYGELLPGCADEWIVRVRERLRIAYVSALWGLATDSRGRGDLPLAAEYLERILSDDPWREDALRALMAVRSSSGDRSSALQLCAQFERRLNTDMGVALMRDTIALRRAIESGEPLPTVPTRQPQGAETPALLPFRGRDGALGRLGDAWKVTSSHGGGSALVLGEAGIGKSRLASEFALNVERRGAKVFWGTTSSPERYPYQAVTEALRSALAFVEPLELTKRDRFMLSHVLPRVAPGGEVGEPAESERAELFDVVAALFARAAQRGPSLIVFEDVHRAGRATVDLLEHLFAVSHTQPTLFLATARDADVDTDATTARLRRFDAKRKPLVVALDRLAISDAIAIATHALPHGDAQTVERIATMSRGHPLFLTELVYAAEEAGGAAPAALPARLRDAIADRIARLSREARLLLQVVAVIGNAFDLDVAAEVAGHSEAQFGAAADELVARRAIRETTDGSRFEFEFAHDVFASIAYEAIPQHRRRRWHRRTAQASQRRYASRIQKLSAFVARHFDLGGEPERAAQHYLMAAQDAHSTFANTEALAYARRGLELHCGSDLLRFDLLALSEKVYEGLADRSGQFATLQALEQLCAVLDDADRTREVVRRQESLHRYLGQWSQAAEGIARLRRLSAGDARWTAIALGDEALLRCNQTSPKDAYPTIVRARSYADRSGDAGVLVPTVAIQAQIAASLGHRAEATACIERAKSTAANAGSAALELTAAHCEVSALTFFQQWSDVVRAGVRLARLANRVGSRNQSAAAHLMVGGACVNLLRVDQGRRHLRAAVERYRGTNVAGAILAYNNLATLEVQTGRLDRVEQILAAMKMVVAENASALGRKCVASTECTLALRRGDYPAAIALANELIRSIELGDGLIEGETLRTKAAALTASGDTSAAVRTLDVARDRLLQAGAIDSARRATADLALACALCSDSRAAEFAEGVLAESPHQSAAEASTLWATARAFHVLGRKGEAADTLGRAHAAYVAQRARLRDSEDRLAYARLPDNRGIERAFSEGRWPEAADSDGGRDVRASARRRILAEQPLPQELLELSQVAES